jgi:hypothetical protein
LVLQEERNASKNKRLPALEIEKMGKQEKETPSSEWPENFSPEMKGVLNRTQRFLTNQYEIRTEVNEFGVAFNLLGFSQGMAKLCILPQKEDSVIVKFLVYESNQESIHFESSQTRARIIGGGETVIFETEGKRALLVDQDSIVILTNPRLSRKEIK